MNELLVFAGLAISIGLVILGRMLKGLSKTSGRHADAGQRAIDYACEEGNGARIR